jgi:hypothetical protein
MQSKTTHETLLEKVFLRQFTATNNGTLADADPAWNTANTENDSETKLEGEEPTLHRMTKVHNCSGCGRATTI